MTAKNDDRDIEQVKVSVEGTVVDWEHKTQINPTTGEVFDFNGAPVEVPKPHHRAHVKE
jgi:hypothetical protein